MRQLPRGLMASGLSGGRRSKRTRRPNLQWLRPQSSGSTSPGLRPTCLQDCLLQPYMLGDLHRLLGSRQLKQGMPQGSAAVVRSAGRAAQVGFATRINHGWIHIPASPCRRGSSLRATGVWDCSEGPTFLRIYLPGWMSCHSSCLTLIDLGCSASPHPFILKRVLLRHTSCHALKYGKSVQSQGCVESKRYWFPRGLLSIIAYRCQRL